MLRKLLRITPSIGVVRKRDPRFVGNTVIGQKLIFPGGTIAVFQFFCGSVGRREVVLNDLNIVVCTDARIEVDAVHQETLDRFEVR